MGETGIQAAPGPIVSAAYDWLATWQPLCVGEFTRLGTECITLYCTCSSDILTEYGSHERKYIFIGLLRIHCIAMSDVVSYFITS